MSNLCVLMLALAANPGPSLPEPADAFERIERAFAAGEISDARRVYWRVAAVTAPHLLPPAWRSNAPHQHARRCATPLLADAFQTLQRLEDDGEEARRLLAPPADLAFSLEASEPFAVRVSYGSAFHQAKAQVVLDAVARAYQKEVVEWGFRAPPVESGSGPYRFYIMEPGPGVAGYTSPYALNHDTPDVDAYTYIVIGPDADDLSIAATVAHEFNHACQVATDVLEVTSFFENTATFIESQVYPEAAPYTAQFFRYFQAAPFRPIEFMQNARSDGYEYGGALWVHFLVHTYGNDDPRWIRQVWEDSAQANQTNEPDYFDVLETTLAGSGGLRGAVAGFSRDRFFVGADDDGFHLPDSGRWTGAEVARAAVYSLSQLPLTDRRPMESATRPQPNGCNYIDIDVDTAPRFPVRFSVTGEAGLEWGAEVYALFETAETAVTPIPLQADATGVGGTVLINALTARRLVLAICQLSGSGYDPDRRPWNAGDYRYSVALDVPPATVTGISPSELPRGSHGELVTIRGSGFVDNPKLAVAMSGAKNLMELDTFVSASELRARVYVAPAAELGARDVLVVNPGSSVGAGAALLKIVDPPPPARAGGGTARSGLTAPGCGCAQAPSGGTGLLVLAAAVVWRCRRRRSAVMLAVLLAAWTSTAGAAPIVGHVESQLHPIRVSYTEAIGETVAREALRYADATWESQISNMGFREPLMVNDNGQIVPGLRIELDADAPYNHAEPVADVPSTPWTDCAVLLRIADTSPLSFLQTVVNHETNHALEMALDCTEAPFAFENTTVAVTTLLQPVNDLLIDHFLPAFQRNPHAGLDCTFFMDANKRYYHYGAALFQVFLEEAYGSNNGRLMSSLWEAARQDGSVTIDQGWPTTSADNSPDLLTAINTVLNAQGASLDEAFAQFARWRYFVGGNDDGAHFEHGGEWGGTEVAIDQEMTAADLPLLDMTPNHNVSDYGTLYLDLNLFGADPGRGLAFDFQGDPQVAWNVDVMFIRADRTAVEESLPVGADSRAQLRWPFLEGYSRAVFVISNLGNGTHDADNPQCNGGRSFTYGISFTDPAAPPVLTSVEPATLEVGKQAYLWINGSGFLDGVTAAVSGSGVEVTEVKLIDAAVLGVAVNVAADAERVPRDVTVTNPRNQAAALTGVITLVEPPAVEDQPRAFGCSAAATAGAVELVSLIALAVLLGRRPARGLTP